MKSNRFSSGKISGAAVVVAVLLAACAGTTAAPSAAAPSAAAPSAAAPSAAAPSAAASPQGVFLCLSNSSITSSWRGIMINDFENEAKRLQATGEVSQYLIQSSGDDVPKQIQQMHNLVASGCKLMIVDAQSATGLNAAISDAKAQGVTVVTFDNTATSTDSTNVLMDETAFSGGAAQCLSDLIGGKGLVLMNEGVAGTPVNDIRIKAAKEIFAKYPEITLIEQNVDWNPAKAKQLTTQQIAQHPDIAAVWTEGDSAGGSSAAFMDAGYGTADKPLPPIFWDTTTDFLNLWHAQKEQFGYKTCGAVETPAQVVDAIWIGLGVMAGREVVSNPVLIPVALVTNDNLDDYWVPGLSDAAGIFLDLVPVPDRNVLLSAPTVFKQP